MRIDSAVFYTNDIQGVVDFYTNKIGLKVSHLDGGSYVDFSLDGGALLAIKKSREEREVPGKQSVFIAVDDVDAEYQKAKTNGLDIVKELTDAGWARVFSILDPDLNKIMFVKRP